MTTIDGKTAYDAVPYPCGAHEETHPDRLATLATLYGLTPAPLDRCRVLELGCGDGSNLFPIASTYPAASFVGIDLSERQIAGGKRFVGELGLTNLTLDARDIMDITEALGLFDYIVVHGVYSWVPRDVQERLLAVCARHLAPHGIAYVSYNVYPGCYFRRIARDLMVMQTSHLTDPKTKIEQARHIVDLIAAGIPSFIPKRYADLMSDEATRLRGLADNYLIHDDLGEINEPLYFHEFAERAAHHDLQFLGESDFSSMLTHPYSEKIQAFLRETDDVVTHEQYLDFLTGRSFRRTLLCRREVAVERHISPALIEHFAFRSVSKPLSAVVDVVSSAPEKFENGSGVVFGLSFPLAKAALVHLAEVAPETVPFENLLGHAYKRIGGSNVFPTAEERTEFAQALLAIYAGAGVALHASSLPARHHISDKPLASIIARHQATLGDGVTNLLHQNIRLDARLAPILPLLDGSRTQVELTEAVATLIDEHRITPLQSSADRPYADRYGAARAVLDAALEKFSSAALLLG